VHCIQTSKIPSFNSKELSHFPLLFYRPPSREFRALGKSGYGGGRIPEFCSLTRLDSDVGAAGLLRVATIASQKPLMLDVGCRRLPVLDLVAARSPWLLLRPQVISSDIRPARKSTPTSLRSSHRDRPLPGLASHSSWPSSVPPGVGLYLPLSPPDPWLRLPSRTISAAGNGGQGKGKGVGEVVF